MKRKFAAAALLLVLILMLTLACSGDETPAAPDADRTQEELLRTIERMSEEMDSLKQEMEESKETRDVDEASVQEDETTLTPTPEMAVIPTPSGPGICGRSPEVQKAILEDLKVNLCRAVTEGELFRITGLKVKMDTANVGDFHGLVNLDLLVAEIKDIEPGAFSGMTSLEAMDLTVYNYGSIAPGAFQGLDSLENLLIKTSKPDSEQENTLSLPDFDQLPSLKHLEMKGVQTLYAETVSDKLLANPPSLESIEMLLAVEKNESDRDTEIEIHIPEGLFASNRMLKIAFIEIEDREGTTAHIPEGLFRNNSSLEEVTMGRRNLTVPTNTFQRLTKLEELRLDEEQDGTKREINLSEKSPLYNKVKYGDQYTQGY